MIYLGLISLHINDDENIHIDMALGRISSDEEYSKQEDDVVEVGTSCDRSIPGMLITKSPVTLGQ